MSSPESAASSPAAWGRLENLREALLDARRRTLELQQDLSDQQMRVPQLRIINPPLWELGHVGWFQEFWILRHLLGRPPLRGDADQLWNSSAVAHDTRWGLALPSREGVLEYLREVLDRVLQALPEKLTPEQAYFCWLALMHEDMHGEAFMYTRQTLAWPAPQLSQPAAALALPAAGATPADAAGDAPIRGGRFPLGAAPGSIAFDNEKWAHWVELGDFAIARAPVSYSQMAEFTDEGGYRRREFWSEDGWQWRERQQAEHPLYWRRDGGTWLHRQFEQWRPLPENTPVIHVNWHEAEAWCRWAGRRLPTEAEWELAASLDPDSWKALRTQAGDPADAAAAAMKKRTFPWGEQPPSPAHATLDALRIGPQPLMACSQDRGGFGLRHLIGNVWEWTASTFAPYPGFVADPYRDYSQPWFTPDYRVLRGGCWATRSRLLRNTWRNFYTRDRNDVLAGFRSCAR